MLQFSYNDAPPLCPSCGKPTSRLFSPTNALFIAEWSRSENIDGLRAMKARMEKDPQLQERQRRADELAARIAEQERNSRDEAPVRRETLDAIVKAGRVR